MRIGRLATAVVSVVLLLGPAAASAEGLRKVNPEHAGLSSERLGRLEQALHYRTLVRSLVDQALVD